MYHRDVVHRCVCGKKGKMLSTDCGRLSGSFNTLTFKLSQTEYEKLNVKINITRSLDVWSVQGYTK